MKFLLKIDFTLLFLFLISSKSNAQLLCISCFEQNDSISQNVNNLVLNGGFENTPCKPYKLSVHDIWCPNSLKYSCDLSNWTCTGGGEESYPLILAELSEQSFIPEGKYSAYFGNSFCRACSNVNGDFSCLISEFCTLDQKIKSGYPISEPDYGEALGLSLEQTISNLIIGNTYVLEFWAGGESPDDESFPDDGLFAVDLGFGNTFLKDPGTPPETGIGRVYVIQFKPESTSIILKFTNWGHLSPTNTELVLDNVRIYKVSELDASVPECITGVNDINEIKSSFRVYPNPGNGNMQVEYDLEGAKKAEFVIMDVMGRVVRVYSLEEGQGVLHINESGLADGVYFCGMIIDGSKSGMFKMIITE